MAERTYKECWFKDNCNKECNMACGTFNEFKYLLDNSNIPEMYKEPKKLYPETVDLEAFKTLANIKNDIENFVDNNRQLYLWSKNTGNGKSNFICKILLTYLALIATGNGFNLNNGVYFCYLPDLITLTTSFENKDRDKILNNIMTRKLICIDDIGSANSKSDFVATTLSQIIDTRYRNNLATIYTSNLSEDELASHYGSRIADRILSDISIELKGQGRRTTTHTY